MRNYNIGDSAYITKQFSISDVETFASISLDNNPIHLNEEYARNSIFGRRIVPGFLVGSLISAVIANKMPGPGSVYLSQNLKFKSPVFIDDTITAFVEIVNIRQDKPIITLQTVCKNESGVIVIEGDAVVKMLISNE